MTSPYSLGVIHGRFQVPHNDHLRYLLAGKALCEHLVVGITNPDPTLTRDEDVDAHRSQRMANPLTYWERRVLIRRILEASGVAYNAVSVTPMPITHPELLANYVPMDAMFFLSIFDDWGRRKLARLQGLGLQTHVLWEVTEAQKGISASDVRERMRGNHPWEGMVPPAAVALLREWDIPGRLRRMWSETHPGHHEANPCG